MSKKMKKIAIDTYTGKEVKIILWNGYKIQGVLRKAKVPFTNAYALANNERTLFFKECHVKEIKVIK